MITVVHYINQFFAGIGGEDKADAAFEIREGAVGPGRALQMAFGEQAEITHTLVCGDNQFHDNRDAILDQLREAIDALKPDLIVAGPAFNAGRYGLACGAVCALARDTFDVPAVTGMFPESPGAEVFHDRVVIVPTGSSAAEMAVVLERIARVGLRLAHGNPLGPAEDEGIIPRSFRGNWVVSPSPAYRAVDMLLAKLQGIPFSTEIPLPIAGEAVAPATEVPRLAEATLAFVTEGGLVPEANPDGIEFLQRHAVGEISPDRPGTGPGRRIQVHPRRLRRTLGEPGPGSDGSAGRRPSPCCIWRDWQAARLLLCDRRHWHERDQRQPHRI